MKSRKNYSLAMKSKPILNIIFDISSGGNCASIAIWTNCSASNKPMKSPITGIKPNKEGVFFINDHSCHVKFSYLLPTMPSNPTWKQQQESPRSRKWALPFTRFTIFCSSNERMELGAWVFFHHFFFACCNSNCSCSCRVLADFCWLPTNVLRAYFATASLFIYFIFGFI